MRCRNDNCSEPVHMDGLCLQDYIKASRAPEPEVTDEAEEPADD